MASHELSSLDEIENSYEGFLFDAYGVLLDGSGLIPAAAQVWHDLRKRGKSCWILTNGSSRTPEQATEAYRAMGLDVTLDEVITSGSLLPRYFEEQGLRGQLTCVLGTSATHELVRKAGGIPCGALEHHDYAVVIIANQTEYPLLETLDAVLTHVCLRVEAGRPCYLILTNPDLIYPKSGQSYGFTAGSLALLLEAGLKLRLGQDAPIFAKLGKPFAPIFAEAERRAGHKKLLMIGDQLETDILGAKNYGIDALLVGTGLTRLGHGLEFNPEPRYILRHWRV
ncbi:MAG TPA: HAD-IIA family hydrolase [Oligoflexus sp.]|uniref:HAD-IIA family hydrolase n=1 Tax=Oligoflexus sp. TaxID=1971216 RepID=UPI002D5C45D1|nr:HAD-IIA family hydrolase [Oligoflexus sp.]HYX33040.1 HAD-IIA family hydrolase [Oligoflexus sp.]